MHVIGSRWAQAYWQVTWALIDEHGYDADIDNFTGTEADKGNIRAMYYIIEGLKNTACSPTFIDVRNGILAAAQSRYGGEDVCRIWRAFAEFGLGANASTPGPNSTSATNGFDIPVSCDYLGSTPNTLAICAGDDAEYPLTLGSGFTPPVTLSVTGLPGAATSSFLVNPVATVPNASALTIGNTGGVAAGSYGLTVSGAHGGTGSPHTLDLTLDVYDAAPGTPAPTSPADGATGVSATPMLTWEAASQARNYVVEVAADAGFGNIVYTATVGTTSATTPALDTNTRYYWRVHGGNACDAGGNSPVFTFRTAPAPGDCEDGSEAVAVFSENFTGGLGGFTTTGSTGAQTWAISTAQPSPMSGGNAVLAVDIPTVSDQRLTSPAISLPADQLPLTLKFQNWRNIENSGTTACWDGGLLEISVNGGEFTQLIGAALLNDPCRGAISGQYGNPLAGKPGWCEPSDRAYADTLVDLTGYAGQSVQLRWRLGTDSSVNRPGWFVDDIRVQACAVLNPMAVFQNGFE